MVVQLDPDSSIFGQALQVLDYLVADKEEDLAVYSLRRKRDTGRSSCERKVHR
jgi:hypothetical protein